MKLNYPLFTSFILGPNLNLYTFTFQMASIVLEEYELLEDSKYRS